MGFDNDFVVLERKLKERAKADQAIWMPTIRPQQPVNYILVGTEPSLKRWSKSEDDARRKIDAGFKMSATTMEDFCLHFAARNYLAVGGLTYYVTDLSKGAMTVKTAAEGRVARYERWYDLLQDELRIVREPTTTIFALGDVVKNFLDGKRISSVRTVHFSSQNGKTINERVYGHEPAFRSFAGTIDFGDIQQTIVDVLTEARMSEWLEETLVRLQRGSRLTEWRKKLIFVYKMDFEGLRLNAAEAPPGVPLVEVGIADQTPRATSLNVVARRYGLEIIDKRHPNDGCLWIVADERFAELLEPFGFKFAKHGGGATSGRPAWWLRGEPKSPPVEGDAGAIRDEQVQ